MHQTTLVDEIANAGTLNVGFGMAKLKSVKRAYPKVYEFTVTLAGTSPIVWRRFLAHEIINLDELHMLIQMTMGWEARHLYEFTFGNKKYAASIHADDSGAENAENAEDVSLNDALGESRKFSYLYDFGDGWRHEVEITKTFDHDPSRKYPVCVAGENACPPEDCGGSPGFEELKEILAGEDSEEKAERLEWLGGFYNPFSFDPNFVNRFLLWADDDSGEFDD